MSDPYNNTGEQALPKNVHKLPVKKKPIPGSAAGSWPAWSRIRKIARLGGKNPLVRVDALQVAAATLEKVQAGRIKSLFVSIEWDDSTFASDWSEMKSSQLVAHAFSVQADVRDQVK